MSPQPRVLLTGPMHPALQPVLAAKCELVLAPDTSAATLKRLIADAEGLVVRAQLPPTCSITRLSCVQWSGTASGST